MFGDLARAVDELVGSDVSMMCDSEVRETLLALRRDVDRLEAFAAALVAVAHHRMIPSGDGASSTPAWLQWQTGQRIGDAKTSLATGLACETLPLTAKAWTQGEISTGAARTICRGRRDEHEDVYAEIEETLVQYAARHDYRGLDPVVRHYEARADALDDREPSERNDLHLSRVGNRWNLQADLDRLAGKTVNTAIRLATDKPSESDTRTPTKRRADALTRICRFFLDHEDVPTEGGERPHVSIGVGWETLTEGRIPESWESPPSPTPTSAGCCATRGSRGSCSALIGCRSMSAVRPIRRHHHCAER